MCKNRRATRPAGHPGPAHRVVCVKTAAMSILLMSCLLFVPPVPTSARQDPVLGDVIARLRDAVEDIIESLEDSADATMFRARQNLELVVNQVEMIAEDSLQTAFSELGAAERQFFNDLQRQIDELRDLGEATAVDAERISDSVAHSIRALPFASTHPVVLSYDPLFVASGGAENEDAVQVEISGTLLASHEPALVVGNTHCNRSEKIDSRLTFLCAKDLFLAEQTVEPLPGKLSVYEDVAWWRFWTEPREHQYDISINVIPALLGRAELSVSTELQNVTGESRRQDFSRRNAFCSGVSRPTFQFNAREGWKIDPASIESSCDRSSLSTCQGVGGVTESSFSYSCTVQNRGSCGYAFGARIWRDARGSCWGWVSWREVREETVLAEETLDARDLRWGTDEIITLPEGTRAVRLAIEKVDGTRRVITDGESRDPWFDVDVDLQRGHVVIRPADLARAMR